MERKGSSMKKSRHILWVVVLILCAGVFGASCKQDDGEAPGEKAEKVESTTFTDANAEADLDRRIEENRHFQPERKKIIDGMLEGGLASRIENPNGEPYIYVMEPFYLLTLEEQAALMNSIWYYFITEDRGVGVLTIYDENTGNEIGTFGRKGLLMGE